MQDIVESTYQYPEFSPDPKMGVKRPGFLQDSLASIKESIRNLSGEKKTVISESCIEEAIAKGDFMKFFLFMEGLYRIRNDHATLKAMKSIEELIDKYKSEKLSKIEVLSKIAEENRMTHLSGASFLTHLVNRRMGNCEARAKLMIVLVKSVFPETEIKVQFFREHMRVIVNYKGRWIAMEPPIQALGEKDFEGTRCMPPEIFMTGEDEYEPVSKKGASEKRRSDSIFRFGFGDLRPYSEKEPPIIKVEEKLKNRIAVIAFGTFMAIAAADVLKNELTPRVAINDLLHRDSGKKKIELKLPPEEPSGNQGGFIMFDIKNMPTVASIGKPGRKNPPNKPAESKATPEVAAQETVVEEEQTPEEKEGNRTIEEIYFNLVSEDKEEFLRFIRNILIDDFKSRDRRQPGTLEEGISERSARGEVNDRYEETNPLHIQSRNEMRSLMAKIGVEMEEVKPKPSIIKKIAERITTSEELGKFMKDPVAYADRILLMGIVNQPSLEPDKRIRAAIQRAYKEVPELFEDPYEDINGALNGGSTRKSDWQ